MMKGHPSSMTQERANLLNGINFVWKAKKGAPRGSRNAARWK